MIISAPRWVAYRFIKFSATSHLHPGRRNCCKAIDQGTERRRREEFAPKKNGYFVLLLVNTRPQKITLILFIKLFFYFCL
jgi:hypothetical protein